MAETIFSSFCWWCWLRLFFFLVVFVSGVGWDCMQWLVVGGVGWDCLQLLANCRWCWLSLFAVVSCLCCWLRLFAVVFVSVVGWDCLQLFLSVLLAETVYSCFCQCCWLRLFTVVFVSGVGWDWLQLFLSVLLAETVCSCFCQRCWLRLFAVASQAVATCLTSVEYIGHSILQELITHQLREIATDIYTSHWTICFRNSPEDCPQSCNLDPIPTELLYENLDVLLPTITNIINISLASGFVPPDFKTAIVKPLLKKPSLDQNVLKNFRPISNLSFLSKIPEKVILHKLLAHLQENNLCNPFQSAYCTIHNTETALLRVVNDMDEDKICVLLLLDRSAAFDTIDHQILLSRQETVFGIRSVAL